MQASLNQLAQGIWRDKLLEFNITHQTADKLRRRIDSFFGIAVHAGAKPLIWRLDSQIQACPLLCELCVQRKIQNHAYFFTCYFYFHTAGGTL